MPSQGTTPYLDSGDDGPSPQTSHPDFVAVAPEWFWEPMNPDSPFGSDDAYDTLSTLQEHFADGGGDEHVPGCVASLIVDWGYVPEQIWESSADEITAWLDADDSNVRFLHGEIDAYIAVACGQFKISGWIHPALRFWAERAMMLLEHVLTPWEQRVFGLAPDEYAEKLRATRQVIDAAPEPPEELQLDMYRGRPQPS